MNLQYILMSHVNKLKELTGIPFEIKSATNTKVVLFTETPFIDVLANLQSNPLLWAYSVHSIDTQAVLRFFVRYEEFGFTIRMNFNMSYREEGTNVEILFEKTRVSTSSGDILDLNSMSLALAVKRIDLEKQDLEEV